MPVRAGELLLCRNEMKTSFSGCLIPCGISPSSSLLLAPRPRPQPSLEAAPLGGCPPCRLWIHFPQLWGGFEHPPGAVSWSFIRNTINTNHLPMDPSRKGSGLHPQREFDAAGGDVRPDAVADFPRREHAKERGFR